MNARQELIAVAIRILASKTSLVRKPDTFEEFINTMFGVESYDKRMARELDSELSRVTEAAKRINTNRKFKKIIQHV